MKQQCSYILRERAIGKEAKKVLMASFRLDPELHLLTCVLDNPKTVSYGAHFQYINSNNAFLSAKLTNNAFNQNYCLAEHVL